LDLKVPQDQLDSLVVKASLDLLAALVQQDQLDLLVVKAMLAQQV
jgi:hypothetical protein